MTLKEAFELGFKAGFASSAEGYNAEYPFNDGEFDYTQNNSYKLDLAIALEATGLNE